MSSADWTGELAPANFAQVRLGKNGRMVTIDSDVGGVVKQLKEIDPRLHVRWSEKGDYFVIYCREEHEPEGTGYAVLYVPELDGRVVKAIQEIAWKNRQPGYSLGKELDAVEDKAEKDRQEKFSKQIAENAELLAWAMRKDLGDTSYKAFIPKDIPSAPE